MSMRAAAAEPSLLDPARLARFHGLVLRVPGGAGEQGGQQRVPGRADAAGLEVEAYRSYTPGDDLRHLDWNALGRLDALLVRRFTAERRLTFHILLDASASMRVPAGADKLRAAQELAMALGFIALAANDGVRTAILLADGRTRVSRLHRHRQAAAAVAGELADATGGGALGLGAALAAHAAQHAGPGVAVVVSDLMSEVADLERGVRALRARRFAVILAQVVAPGELDPGRTLRHGVLRDAESDDVHAIRLTRAALAEYRTVVEEHLAALRALAARTGSVYGRLVAGTSVADFITGDLARLGLVRRR
jgi:uncharacterized protein (DUF58 family)